MSQPKQHPLSLPEIKSAVAQYLDKPDLANATLVCKDWNASFSAFLYHKAWLDNLGSDHYDGLSAHAEQVRDLTLRLGPNYMGLPSSLFVDGDISKGLIFTRLRTLLLRLSFEENTDEWWKEASQFASRNPGLEEVRVVSKVSPLFLKALSAYCPHLSRLSFWDTKMDQAAMEALLDLCTASRLVSLILSSVDASRVSLYGLTMVRELASPMSTEPLRLEVLRFAVLGLSLRDQIAWAQRCPQLKTLHLYFPDFPDGQDAEFPTQLFCEALSTTIPEVNHLYITCYMLTLIDLAHILESFGPGPRIKYFGVGRDVLGVSLKPKVLWPLLDRHLSVLTHLNMAPCKMFESEQVQHALATFPHLISLQAKYLKAMDILGRPTKTDKAMNIPPWVCKSLRFLEVHIDGFEDKPKQWNALVLKQISTLRSLELLDIQLHEYGWYDPADRLRSCLDLRLEAGLKVLAPLKHMRQVSCTPELQLTGEEELEWMKNAWPRFEPQLLWRRV